MNSLILTFCIASLALIGVIILIVSAYKGAKKEALNKIDAINIRLSIKNKSLKGKSFNLSK
jgi:hypothetical protein